MLAKDQTTGAQADESYSAEGATSFIGTPSETANSQGFFTGLMTEWYHSDPYYGNEQKVVYTVDNSAISSAWMWIYEFNSQNKSQVLFSDYTPSPASYTNPNQLQELSSNGATEYSDAYEFITGSLSAVTLTLSYSITGGGYSYLAPMLTYTFNGVQRTTTLSSAPVTYYADVGTSWSVTNPLTGSTPVERWQTDQPTNGIANSSETINLAYYHQYSVTFGFSVLGGGSGYSEPEVTYQEFGGSLMTTAAINTVWADATSYYYPASLPGSLSAERWATNSSSGYISSPGPMAAKYYHQFLLTASYSVIGGGRPDTPMLYSTASGSPFSLALTTQSQGFWIDDGASYSVANSLPGSSNSERWESNSTVEGKMYSSHTISISYFHQYYVRVQPNAAAGGSVSLGSGWFDAGASLQATASTNSGWEFEGWNGSGGGSYSGTSNTASMVVNAPLVETATFYPGLTITASSETSVSYSYGSMSGFLPAGTSQTIFAPQGTNITLMASPTSFIYSFGGWSGATTSGESAIYVILNFPLSLMTSYSFNYLNIGILSAILVVATAVMVLVFIKRGRMKTPF